MRKTTYMVFLGSIVLMLLLAKYLGFILSFILFIGIIIGLILLMKNDESEERKFMAWKNLTPTEKLSTLNVMGETKLQEIYGKSSELQADISLLKKMEEDCHIYKVFVDGEKPTETGRYYNDFIIKKLVKYWDQKSIEIELDDVDESEVLDKLYYKSTPYGKMDYFSIKEDVKKEISENPIYKDKLKIFKPSNESNF